MARIVILIVVLSVYGCSDSSVDTPNKKHAENDTEESVPISGVDDSDREDGVNQTNETSTERDALTPIHILTRASIDIRGQRPSRDELRRLATSPERLDEMLDEFLDDPGFAQSVADLFSRALRNRSDMYRGADDDDGPGSPPTYQQSVADESLMLIRHIVSNDLSYDEFLKADYTFANQDFASVWGMTGYDTQIGGWQRVHYGDGRPAAGYLSMSSVFMRFLNDDANYNRGRANAMSRILLCSDFLKIPVDFPRDLDLSDENAIDNAISTNAACTTCHNQLDPLASFFSVYTEPDPTTGDIRAQYTPDNADEWMETTGKAPAFYGRPGNDLADLAGFILEDPRYARCAVSRVYEGLLDRAATSEDSDAIRQHLEVFEDNGRTFKSLYRSVMADPVYRGIAQNGRSATTAKMLSPELLQRVVTHITGFHPKSEGVDIMRAGGEGESAGNAGGFRILGGGLSAFSGDYPSRTANVTRVLVQARLADSAALYVVARGGSKADSLVDNLESPPGASGVEQLFRNILGRDPNQQEVDEFTKLYQSVIEDGADTDLAYAALISVLLRDPEFVIY